MFGKKIQLTYHMVMKITGTKLIQIKQAFRPIKGETLVFILKRDSTINLLLTRGLSHSLLLKWHRIFFSNLSDTVEIRY